MSVAIAEMPIGIAAPPKKNGRKIPDYLVREVIDDIPFYYAGYREVLNKTKTSDEIMPHSTLQGILKNYVGDELKLNLDRKQYYVIVGETGTHINHKNNLGLDVAVFDKAVLTPDKINDKFAEVPPALVVEIDIKVELPDRNANLFDEFIRRKIRRLFAFGTKRVIWIFSKPKSVLIATPNAPWLIMDWDKDVELFNGIHINIARYLEEEGIHTETA